MEKTSQISILLQQSFKGVDYSREKTIKYLKVLTTEAIQRRKLFAEIPYESPILGQPISLLGNLDPYSGAWTFNGEPGPK
jgi:hypothetical protein